MGDKMTIALPLFGGGDAYVDTLEKVLEFVELTEPDEAELKNWFKAEFDNVSSDYSIKRRLTYLSGVGFLNRTDEEYRIGPAGERVLAGNSSDVIFNVMHNRVVGFTAILRDVRESVRDTEELSERHEQDYDQAKWKVNWHLSMGLVEKIEDGYVATEKGTQFLDAYTN